MEKSKTTENTEEIHIELRENQKKIASLISRKSNVTSKQAPPLWLVSVSLYNFRVVVEPLPSRFRAVSESFPSHFRAVVGPSP